MFVQKVKLDGNEIYDAGGIHGSLSDPVRDPMWDPVRDPVRDPVCGAGTKATRQVTQLPSDVTSSN